MKKTMGKTKLREPPFIYGSFHPMSHSGHKTSLSGVLSGEGMRRWRGVALLLSILCSMGLQRASALPLNPEGISPSPHYFRPVEERPDGATRKPEINKSMEPRKRNGQTQYWGGPYWGYGARFGHPCDVCRNECGAGKKTPDCERCRMRCGWSEGIGR